MTCYICHPDDHDADDVCGECDREFWEDPVYIVLDDEDGPA